MTSSHSGINFDIEIIEFIEDQTMGNADTLTRRRTKSFTCDRELADELDRIVEEESVVGSRIIERALREFLVRTRPHRFVTEQQSTTDLTQPS